MNMRNEYIKNLNRIEFFVTLACTGNCMHCSEGEHTGSSEHIDADTAEKVIYNVCKEYKIDSIMTFGGEALLYPDAVCRIHAAAAKMNVPKRQLITNGYFTKDINKVAKTAEALAKSGVNAVLLSVDAFHQETIPLEIVKRFAMALQEYKVPVRTHPAWLVSKEDDNPYNNRTKEILNEFEMLGIYQSDGNIIFPSGNAKKYLAEYFQKDSIVDNPYEEDPCDVRAISISPCGDVLGENVYQKDILKIIESYVPGKCEP